MKTQFKPTGYNSVSPYFMVDNAQKMIDMLIHVFDGTEKRKYLKPDGKIMHAEVQIDDSIIMVSDATEQYPPYSFWMHVYVSNVNDIFNKAVAYGCEPVEQPINKDGDEDRRGTFKDSHGNHWSVASQTS